jgi:DNA-binding transcriptional LysR family regulator
VLKAAAMAGLGISAFADYVVPQGLVRLEHDMPDLGHLEFVIDKPAHASPAVCALESTLRIAALDI